MELVRSGYCDVVKTLPLELTIFRATLVGNYTSRIDHVSTTLFETQER